jgi:hypothetical protein
MKNIELLIPYKLSKQLVMQKNALSKITLMPMIYTDQWILEDKEERFCTDRL